MLRRGSFTVASDKDIIEKARNFQTLLERHPEFDRRTKPSHSTSKTTSGPWLDYKARSPEQLQRALNERQKERDKEYGWTQKQVQQLKKEQRRLAEEQERLIKAKERWGSPIGVLPKSDQNSSLPRDEPHLSRSEENLEQLRRHSTNFISPETVISSWQAPEYYLIRELLVHLINNAVDTSEEAQFQKIADISEFQLKARRQNRDERESQQDQRKLANPLSEDLLNQCPAESVCSTVPEPINRERYILWQMEQIIIGSAERAVVGNRGRDDPAYDLVTGTYHHMVTERQSKRKNIWQHTQLLQTSDAVQPAGALALLDPDTQQLNFLSLRTFDLNFCEDVPAFRIYKHHEIECWNQFTIESTLLNINKKVIGVSALEVSTNQQQIAVGTMKGDIITYSLMQDQPQAVRYIRNESALGDPLISLTWSLDGNRIMNVSDSGMLRVWSTLPAGRLVKDAKELDLVNTSTDSVPPQLTLLITMDDQEKDFNFQAGPLSDTGAQKETDFPSVAAFHPSCTLLATQNSIVVGLQSGDLLKCNAVFDTSVESDVAAAPNIHFPEISVPKDNCLGQDIRGELFRGHRVPLICVGFISNFDDMVTVDTAGNIFVWKYDRNNLSHFGWFRPHQKYSLFLAERVYEINENEDKVIYFSDESAAEMKKKKGSELAEIKKKWEKRREAAEGVIVRTKYRRLFLKEADSKGNRVTTICEPMVVDGRGSYFHGTIREISTKKLLKHFGQMYKVVKSYCARLIGVKMGPSGSELVFCLLFPPFYPKEPHISFITVLLKPEVKVHNVRIDVLLNENEYFRCLNDNVCQFAVSQVLDASKSSYLFVTLLGSLLIYSRNTRSLLVSSRERDQPFTSVGSLKALQRLNIRSHIRLAHCAGHVQAILFAKNDPVVNIFHVTDRNIPEKRRLLYKAYKLWKQTPTTVPVEMTTRRRKYILDRDDCRHVELYVNRLVLQLVDRAVQGVDANDLTICQPGLSCCTRDLEHQLWIKARHDYHSSIQSSVSYLKYTLSTAVIDFQGEYEDLLQYGEDGIHQHFGRSHPNIASNMHRSFELLFIDLQAYLQGHNINIDRSLGDFFDGLFPHVYSAYMNVGRLSNIYMQCLARERTVISPFGREDDTFSADLQNSLKVTRTLLQSLKLGLGVLNTTEHMPLSVKCKEVLTEMRYCPFCQGLTYTRPCHGYCLNVMKGCLANFMDLDIYWTEYVTSVVDLIRSSMSADFDLQQVMHSLDNRIDRAIDYAVDNKDDITHAVLERCGPPPQMRQSNYNDYAINSPPMNVPIAPNPGVPLDERLLSFVETLDNSRGMYRNLPASVCQDESMSSQSNSNCWNGRNVDRYTEEVVADGTVAQQWNPEVPLTGREPELVDALMLMDKLQKAARKTKMILESFEDEDEEEELGDYMYSGSGSGEEMGSGCAFSDDEDCEKGSGGDFIGRGGKPGSPNITPTDTDLRYSPTPEPKLGDDPDKADSRQGDEVGTTKSSLSNKRATQSALLTAFATITGYLVVRWSL